MFIHVSHSSYIVYVPTKITPVLPISFTLLLQVVTFFESLIHPKDRPKKKKESE